MNNFNNTTNNNLYISNNFITNFKPNIINDSNNMSYFKNKKKNHKYCKLFLIYIILFKYKNSIFFKKSNVFVKKFKKNVFTVLRSPYRHKLARHQIFLNRYKINFSLKIPLKKKLICNNFYEVLKILYFFKKIDGVFESNLIYISNLKLSFKVFYNKIFIFNY